MPGPEGGRSDRAANSARALRDPVLELAGRIHGIDEPPFHRAPPLDALGHRSEHVGEVAPHFPLVDDAGEAARARKHGQQRRFRQAHGRVAIIDEDNLVARERQLIAAAGTDAVERGQELQPRVRARVFDRQPRLVRELAEVHLPRVARPTQHEDVGAGAEDALLQAGDDDRVDLGMLEAEALNRVGEFDVDAKVVGIELEPVVRRQPRVFLDVHRQGRNRAVERELPMAVSVGSGVERHAWLDCVGSGGHLGQGYPWLQGLSRQHTAGSILILRNILL